jgi:transposase-like protein
VSEICNAYGVGQSQYYRWRDQFMAGAHKAFEAVEKDRAKLKLEKENRKLKTVIGEMALELKKSD